MSIAPVQVQATPIVSMAAPQTQIISSTCAPLALAANTTQGQQIALAQQSMSTLSTTNQPLSAAHASQILGTSQITLTPTLAQGKFSVFFFYVFAFFFFFCVIRFSILCSAINGSYNKYITGISNVKCYTTNYFISGNDA